MDLEYGTEKKLAEPVAAANGLGCHADCGAAGTPAGGTSQVLSVRHEQHAMYILVDRWFQVFGFVCLFFLMIAGVMVSQDRFVFTASGHNRVITRRVITRAAHPMFYWGVTSALFAIAVTSAALAIRRAKKVSTERLSAGQTVTPRRIIPIIAIAWLVFICLLIVLLRMVPVRSKNIQPNQAAQPTTTAITSPAGQEARQP